MSRIARLVADMTLEEKIGQLVMVSLGAETIVTGPKAAKEPTVADVRAGRVGSVLNLVGRDRIHALQRVAVEESRLKIPVLFGLDVVHGYRVTYPVPLAEAASFRPDLWEATARFAAAEAAEDGLALTFAPMLDVARDPRWGRIIEGPGEDPHVGREMARAKVAGFQGTDPTSPVTMAATAKHFAGYGGATAGRDYASAEISERTLHEVYLPAFEAAVKAGALAIMPGFHDIAGRPMSADRPLLTELVRDTWGFQGIYVSDYDAVGELVAHGVAADMVEAAALALKAGMDLDMMSPAYPTGLAPALERGLITIADIDAAVTRVLSVKERLGLFEAPFGRGDPAVPSIRTEAEQRALARESGAASLVLLKNDGAVLPLAPTGGPIALIGPWVEDGPQMLGSWYGLGDHSPITTLRAGLEAAFPGREIRVIKGCDGDFADDDANEVDDILGIAAAVDLARTCDVVLLAIGEPALMTGEAASRGQLGLTGRQADLARSILDTGKPVVYLLNGGRPLIETELIEDAAGVLMIWYPGSEAGHAVADVVSGKVAPSGKLPVSWPIDMGQIPIFYGERPSGRPYVEGEHFTTQYLDLPNLPLFPFGHGLSYTTFDLAAPTVDRASFRPGEPVTVTTRLANTGAREAATTVFLFSRDVVASTARPLLELRRFETVTLAPGEGRDLAFTLTDADFALLDRALKPALEAGAFELSVGFSADRTALKTVTVRLEAGGALVA